MVNKASVIKTMTLFINLIYLGQTPVKITGKIGYSHLKV